MALQELLPPGAFYPRKLKLFLDFLNYESRMYIFKISMHRILPRDENDPQFIKVEIQDLLDVILKNLPS